MDLLQFNMEVESNQKQNELFHNSWIDLDFSKEISILF